MSATGRSDVRHPDDFYATPAWCVEAILPHLRVTPETAILEPSAGDGAIIRVLHARGFRNTLAIELDFDRCTRNPGTYIATDFLRWAPTAPPHDLVIGNPPFSLAMEFVQAALPLASAVAMLLRLPWLASQKRAPWLRAHTPSVYVLPKRPSFTGKGTDATDYAWMVWGPTPPTVTILDVAAAA